MPGGAGDEGEAGDGGIREDGFGVGGGVPVVVVDEELGGELRGWSRAGRT